MKKNTSVNRPTQTHPRKLNLTPGDRTVGIIFLALLALTAVLTVLGNLKISLVRGEILLFMPFLLICLLLGWGVSVIVRRIKRPVLKTVVGVALGLVLAFVAMLGFSYVSFVATLSIPQPYNTLVSPSGAHRLVVLRTLDADEERVQAHAAARQAADPESSPDVIAEDYFYSYTAYPTLAHFFYKSDADVEGAVITSYVNGATLMVEWSDDESEAHFFAAEPGVGEGGDLYVRF